MKKFIDISGDFYSINDIVCILFDKEDEQLDIYVKNREDDSFSYVEFSEEDYQKLRFEILNNK